MSDAASAFSSVRNLRVFADGREIAQSCRIRLSLIENMSLLPALCSLEIENLSEASEALLSAASIVEVHSSGAGYSLTGSGNPLSSSSDSNAHVVRSSGAVSGSSGIASRSFSGSASQIPSASLSSHAGSSILASGSILSVFPRIQSGRRILSVSFSPGMALWQSAVSLSLTGGMRVSDTIRAILAASGTGIRLSAFLAEDRPLSRPQAFFGRACDALRLLAESVRARICLTPAGLCVVDPSQQSPTLFLPEDALRSDPVFLHDRCILSTEAAGWPLGTCLRFRWKGSSHQGLLSARMLNLDNGDGPWQSQLEVTLSS